MTRQSPDPASPDRPQLNPGDEAPPGAPGTGEDLCPVCGGTGTQWDQPCTFCGGTGRITRAIGGG